MLERNKINLFKLKKLSFIRLVLEDHCLGKHLEKNFLTKVLDLQEITIWCGKTLCILDD